MVVQAMGAGINPYFGSYGSGIDYTDLECGSYPTMGGSIFGGMPMLGGVNSSMYANMIDNQKFYNQYNVNQYKLNRFSDLQVNAPMEGIQDAAVNVKDKILKNEQDQIPKAYEAYLQSVQAAYGEGSAEEIKSRALALYERMNGGSLIEDIRKHSNDSLTQGFLNALTFGLFYRNSGEDNIAKITGQPVATADKAKQIVGRLGGVLTVGGAAYGLTKLASLGKCGKALGQVAKVFKGKAGIVGATVAGVAAALSLILG